MKYVVDIDGTICTSQKDGHYENAKPLSNRIKIINGLYNAGHEIHYWTARGGNSGRDLSELTKKQLEEWGCKYTSLRCDKPAYDLWIDDKSMSDKEFFYDIDNWT
jgi:hypothetical protein